MEWDTTVGRHGKFLSLPHFPLDFIWRSHYKLIVTDELAKRLALALGKKITEGWKDIILSA
jgi:hypothetical protein